MILLTKPSSKDVDNDVGMKQSTGMTRKIAPRSDDFETYEEYKAYIEQVHTVLPLATDAETGKPISSEPASPWARPTD